MLNNPSILIVYGGGLDSAAMATFAHQRSLSAHLLHFDYGQKACRGERASMGYFASKFQFAMTEAEISPDIVPRTPLTTEHVVTDLNDQKRNEVPGRNVMFLALAFSMATRLGTVHTIWIGADIPVTGGGFNDQKQPTFDAFNAMTAFAYGERSPRVHAPLLAFRSKMDYLRHAFTSSPELFTHSFSCYDSSSLIECGVCNHCQSKRIAQERLRAEAIPLSPTSQAGR